MKTPEIDEYVSHPARVPPDFRLNLPTRHFQIFEYSVTRACL